MQGRRELHAVFADVTAARLSCQALRRAIVAGLGVPAGDLMIRWPNIRRMHMNMYLQCKPSVF